MCVVGAKRVPRFEDPENRVAPEMLVPLTEEAVTAVNIGDPITPTIGLEEVPPVYALTPGVIKVEGPNRLFKFVDPEMKFAA